MNNKEILQKAKKDKDIVGEMEKTYINRSNWIGNITACVFAVILMIVEGFLGHFTSIYAIASVIFIWASVFYYCQFFIAKRPWQVLIGAVLNSIGFIINFTFFILYAVGVL
ncbi:MAG: hypothetical protein IJF75_04310 [Clostridia bacterium]|nr:hypothetical protein [Clostridia bacterium]